MTVRRRTACSTWRRRTSPGSRSAPTSILIPIGSCEQHGAHLPLGTDTITALEVSRRAAREGRRAVRAAVLGRLLAAAPARHRVGRRHDHAAREHAERGALRHRALAHPPRLEQARVRQRPRLQHEGARPAAAPDQVRDRRVRRALQAVRRALHRDARRAAGEPAGGDAGLARVRARDVAGDGARPVAGEDGARRGGPRAGARLAAGLVHQEGRRARRRVRRLPVLRLPDGPRRVLAHRRDRQPDARDAGEGRGGAGPLRRPPRASAIDEFRPLEVDIKRRAFEERV